MWLYCKSQKENGKLDIKRTCVMMCNMMHLLMLASVVGVVVIAELVREHFEMFGVCSSSDETRKDSLYVPKYNVERFASSISAAVPVHRTPHGEHESEALASLHLAQEMVSVGKLDKAVKLFDHALALDGAHPDILNGYGEFLELHNEDVIQAEHMYSRAVTCSPVHTRALANRQRTLPIVEEIDHRDFRRIDSKRDQLIRVPDSHPGLRRMKKESYFKHVHHTTAIEGNTFSLAQTRSLLETRLALAGKSIMEHNEIIGLDAALSFINSTLLHRVGPIRMSDILAIHKRVLGFVDPMEAGQFRSSQVFIGDFVPPRATDVERLVDEFVEWLNDDDTLALHPIEHAALAHYKLVVIHPFYDGNGRTSRLLMNLLLMQAGFPPVIIRVDEKYEYYQHLNTANQGDVRPFIRFISRCTERTLDEFLQAAYDNVNLTRISGQDDGRTIIIEPYDDSYKEL